MQIDSDSYRNEQALPPGRVLIVGSGQSGCQIAEELRAAGRDVVLACGRAPWLPRRIGDHDFIWWAVETGYLDAPVDSLPDPAARLTGNILATGRDGGHDLHLRTLQQAGVTLAGRLLGVVGHRARFADDLQASVAWGDERYRLFGELVQQARPRDVLSSPSRSPNRRRSTPIRRKRSTSEASARSSSPPGSGPTTPRGCPGPRPSTSSGSRSTTTVPAAPCPGSTSPASTSCASASRRFCWAWAKMPPWSLTASPARWSAHESWRGRPAGPGVECASDASARHERRERRELAAADGARRRGAAVAGRAPRGAGARGSAAGVAARSGRIPLGLRLGEPRGDLLLARAA